MQQIPPLIARLSRSQTELSKSQRSLAEYIAGHTESVLTMTAKAVATACGVSESTVVRFAAALGYEGYPEMRQALGELVRDELTTEQRFRMTAALAGEDVLAEVLRSDAQNIRKTMESLSRADFESAVERLLGARRVYVMGLRSAAPLALFMYHYLHQILEDVALVQNSLDDVFEEVARIGTEDVLVGISYPRYSTRTLECMRFARQNGAQVIALTDSELSPLKECSTVCLCAATDMTTFVDSLSAPLSVINALAVSVGLHRSGHLQKHYNQLEGIWDAHRVYIGKNHE